MTPAKNTPNKDEKPASATQETPEVPTTRQAPETESTETAKTTEVDAPTNEQEQTDVKKLASEVLAGRWGANYAEAAKKLEEAGHNSDAVWAEYTRRKAAGAPSAF